MRIIGKPHDADNPRTYRAARFKTIQMLDQPAGVPEDFDLKEYFGNAWAVYRGDKTYDVEIQFTPKAAKVVTETVWHHTQQAKSHKDGSVTLSFQVDGLGEITKRILAWTGSTRAIQPSELNERVLKELLVALEMHRR